VRESGWVTLGLLLLGGFWFWMAYRAWKKKSTWDKVHMRWVKSPRRHPKEYYFEVVFNSLMGSIILIVICWKLLGK